MPSSTQLTELNPDSHGGEMVCLAFMMKLCSEIAIRESRKTLNWSLKKYSSCSHWTGLGEKWGDEQDRVIISTKNCEYCHLYMFSKL